MIEDREVVSLIISNGMYTIAGNDQQPRELHTVVLYDIEPVIRALRGKYATVVPTSDS